VDVHEHEALDPCGLGDSGCLAGSRVDGVVGLVRGVEAFV
jgi:hypothetical protein